MGYSGTQVCVWGLGVRIQEQNGREIGGRDFDVGAGFEVLMVEVGYMGRIGKDWNV